MRVKTILLALCAVAAATAPTAAAAPPAGPGAVPPPNPGWDTRLTVADRRASDVALAVETRPAFSGIRVTPDHSAVEVYVIRHDPALEAAARAAAGAATVRFTRVRHSYTALRALQRRVLGDFAAGRLGARLTGAPVIDSLNRVAVEIQDFTAANQNALLARYGRDNVVVRRGNPSPGYAASRLDDFAAWNSGSFIYATGKGGCTSGPGVKDSAGTEYLLSAGHCFLSESTGGATGWDFPVYQGGTFRPATDPRLGTAKARFPRDNEQEMDIALMTVWGGGSGLSFVTTSPTATTPYSRKQKGTIRAVENTWVCFSGAYTGERCGAMVDAFDDPYPVSSGGSIIHVNRAHHVFSEVLAGAGDSGGPVYQSADDGLYVAGLIRGPGDGTEMQCPAFPYYNRGVHCNDSILFTGINSTLAHFGVTLNTRL
ncbi:MAG TPA: hypothetical protein VF519_06410 [Mycobacteriales bacterium]|jgi:hypothetical protein